MVEDGLHVQDVAFRYGRTVVLHEVTLHAERGVVAVLGPNGAGKSTLLRLLAGHAAPSHGELRASGRTIRTGADRSYLRSICGYLPQNPQWQDGFSVEQLVRYFAALRLPRHHVERAVERALALVDLENEAGTRLGRLSGGQRRRAFLAQAMVHDPPILILDEPTAGLDPVQRIQFRRLVVGLGAGRLVLLATHLVEDVQAAAARIVVLNEGSTTWEGTPDAALSAGDRAHPRRRRTANRVGSGDRIAVAASARHEAELMISRIRTGPWYLAPAALVIGAGLLWTSPPAEMSSIWSAEMALAAIVVVWPMTAGVAAMEQVRLVRTRSVELVDALPRKAATTATARRALLPAAWTIIGLTAAVALAGLVALGHGSPLSWRAVEGVPLALLGALAFSTVGAAAGRILPSWLTPPAVAVACYVVLAFDVLGLQALTTFVGATSAAVVSIHTPVPVQVRIAIFFTIALVVGVAATLARQVGATWLGVLCIVVGVGLLGWRGGLAGTPHWEWRDDAAWPCRTVSGTDALVCLPDDQRRDLDLLATELTPMTARLLDLAPDRTPIRFTTVPTNDSIRLEPPFGAENLDQAGLAMSVSWELAPCLREADGAAGALQQESLTPAALVVAYWLVPEAPPARDLLSLYDVPPRPPSLAEAQAAHTTLQSC